MGRYECAVCHGICDPGELTGGVCQECTEEERQRQIRTASVVRMIKAPFKQMELKLEELGNG